MRQLEVVLTALLLLPVVLLANQQFQPSVQDSIVRKATALPKATCGSTMACSVVAAVALCDCRFDATLNRVLAKATLRLMGTIYYYSGAFRAIAQRPRDRSVVDQQTAIEHEYAYHITPAVSSVAGMLENFERVPYATIAECMLAGSDLAKNITTAFQQALVETQVREVALGR